MELQYEKALKEYNLKYSQLPEDAKIGIDSIGEINKAFNMLKSKNKAPTDKALRKLKTIDKWVYYEILDFVHGTDNNDEDMPDVKDDIKKDVNQQIESAKPIDPVGIAVETELENVFKQGKTKLTMDELKASCKKCYDIIFKEYEEGQPNGITTSKYSLLETEKHNFNLTKK
jgi:hypothetical protein